MQITIYSISIKITAATVVALLGFAKWLISRRDNKKKNPPQQQ